MNPEQNMNNVQEKIITNESVQEVVPNEVISEEDKQAKVEKKIQNKIDDDKKIYEIRKELIGENSNSEISGSEAYDIYSKWKEEEVKKIEIRRKEMNGQTKASTISDRGPVVAIDSKFSLIDLENSGQLKFIEFATKEGNKKDISAAIKLLDLYYKDRNDLKEKLLNKQ